MIASADKIKELIANKNVSELAAYMKDNNLELINGKIRAKDQELAKWYVEDFDKKQTVRKLSSNGLYGAILNEGCRFQDPRIGQSTTLTGRVITRHMNAGVNEALAGEYDHTGVCLIYGDTDSGYFSAWPVIKDDVAKGNIEWNKDIAVQLYNDVADQINDRFPTFMESAFHCSPEKGKLVRCGREIVAERGLFITKKRYAALIYDLDGKRQDVDGKPGKLKAMGLDLKRADTPKFVQDFLKDVLMEVLLGKEQEDIVSKIKAFKDDFKNLPPWKKGTPKRVNKLLSYSEKEKKLGKANMPGHVRAAMNWNRLRNIYSDKYSVEITDGMKAIVCKIKDNPTGMTSVAYPIDQAHLPDWFLELPFDHDLMESSVVDKKLENLLCTLDNWDEIQNLISDNNAAFDDLFGF
jgi:DNA polymerase elongation subunit (family B)